MFTPPPPLIVKDVFKTVLHHLRALAKEIYKSQYNGYFYSSGNGCLQSYYFSSATKPINNELNTRS